MNRKRHGTAKRTVRKGTGGGIARKPPDIEALRQRLMALIASRAYGMVEATADEVELKGNGAGLKLLLEFIGLYPPVTGVAAEEGESDAMSKELLRQLGLAGQPKAEAVEVEANHVES